MNSNDFMRQLCERTGLGMDEVGRMFGW
jgi:hypothetical protein